MIVCPSCGHENLEGAETCEHCQHSLSGLDLSPATGIEAALAADSLASLSPKSPVTVTPEDSVRDVLKTMVEKSVGCVVVADADGVKGIFSERDVVKRIGSNIDEHGDKPVREFMTPNPGTLHPEDKVAFAVQRMDLGGYRHVPVVDSNDQLTGVISVRDILHYLTTLSK